MTPAGAKKLTVGAVVVSGVLASVEYVERGQRPPLRIALGGLIVGAALVAVADSAPQLAGGFAVLLLLGALLNTGGRAIPAIRKAVEQ